jgi:lysophospholipase
VKPSVVVLFLFALSQSLGAISEAGYSQRYQTEVQPFYATGRFGSFAGVDGVRIRYAAFEAEAETAALVILPGCPESFIKYAELIYDLQPLTYSIYLMDQRGMGFSERLLDDPTKIHVQKFTDYLADTRTFFETVVQERPHDKLFVLGHSTGGVIAALYLESYHDVNAAVLTCPAFEVRTDPVPLWLACLAVNVLTFFGQGEKLAPGQGESVALGFEEKKTTHSAVRYRKWEDEILSENPEIQFGGRTNRWVKESMKYGRRAWRKAGKIQVPLLLLYAEEDLFVAMRGYKRFAKRAPDCTMIMLPDSWHEILFEKDTVRDQTLQLVTDFFDGH